MTKIPTAAQLERLIDEVRPILARVPQLVRQANEWADEGVKGLDPGKVNVRGGSITNPTEAAALRGTRCQWGEMVERIQRNERAILDGLTLTALRPELSRVMWVRSRAIDLTPQFATQWLIAWRAAAEQLIADARAIDHRHHETDRKTKNELTRGNERVTSGPCAICEKPCSGDRHPKPDTQLRPVLGHHCCPPCVKWCRENLPEGAALSDAAYFPEMKATRRQLLSDARKAGVPA